MILQPDSVPENVICDAIVEAGNCRRCRGFD